MKLFFSLAVVLTAFAVSGCKAVHKKNSLAGKWKVTRSEVYVIPEKKYQDNYKYRWPNIANVYMQLKYEFNEDSGFIRTLENVKSLPWMNFSGRMQKDTTGQGRWILYNSYDSLPKPPISLRVLMDSSYNGQYQITEIHSAIGMIDYWIKKED
ncbi:MAG: hypothetical protein IPG86_05115 [Chitinophagaceae bacterium]|nr:hypothetical protein [Chitinophagaceae bacterium]